MGFGGCGWGVLGVVFGLFWGGEIVGGGLVDCVAYAIVKNNF